MRTKGSIVSIEGSLTRSPKPNIRWPKMSLTGNWIVGMIYLRDFSERFICLATVNTGFEASFVATSTLHNGEMEIDRDR